MAVFIVTNEVGDFTGLTASTTAGDFNADYVDSAILTPGGNNVFSTMPVSWDPLASTGDTWIHYDRRVDTNSTSGGGQGSRFKVRDENGSAILTEIVNNGFSTYQAGDGNTFGPTQNGSSILQTIDVHISRASGGIFNTTIYQNEVQFATTTYTLSTTGMPAFVEFALDDVTGYNNQYTSQILIQDTSTLGRRVGTLRPSSAGSDAQWTGDFNVLGDDDIATVAASNLSGQRVSSLLNAWPGPQSGAIEKIILRSAATAQGGAPTRYSQYLKIGGVNYDQAVITPGDSVTRYYDEVFSNPSTTNAFLFTELATLQIGLVSLA